MPRVAPDAAQRNLRAIVSDGIAFSVMVGIGETYLPAFALAIGHGEVAAGLLATLPMLAGAVVQLVTPLGVRTLASYRRWVVLCARLQALSFAPLIVGALLGRLDLQWIFLAAAAYWSFGLATSPAWNAWVGVLIPPERRAAYFARRSRWAQAALFAGIVAGGLILDRGRASGSVSVAFAVLFVTACAARLTSSVYLASQSEPPDLARSHRNLTARELYSRFRRGNSGRLLAYLLALQVAVHVAAPFFTPYMLVEIELSYARFTALTAASFLARVLVLPSLGRLAHHLGSGALLWIGAAAVVPLPALWLVSDSFGYLFALQLLAGAAWAALELATLLAFFEALDVRERTSILTVFNLANAAAMALGTLLGGELFILFAGNSLAYAAVFAVSSAARLATLALVRKVPRVVEVGEIPALRTVAVRPSIGALQRPVLPTLDVEPGRESSGSPASP